MDKPRIVFAPSDTVESFPAQMDRLLMAIGHPEALVSDESQVADFLCMLSSISVEQAAAMEKAFGHPVRAVEISPEDQARMKSDNDQILDDLAQVMGRQVKPGEYLAQMARELYLADQPNTLH